MYPHLFGHKTYGRLTQAANTKIVRLVEPCRGAYTALTFAEITVSTTAHILTVMKPLGSTTLTADAAASQAVISIAADPGDYTGYRTSDNAIAANDYVVLEMPDGTFVADTVSSVSSLDITLTTNLPTGGMKSGSTVWFYGIETDTNPFDALAHARYTLPASSTVVYGNAPGEAICGFFGSNRREEPILLIIDNGTAASTLERVQVAYSQKGGKLWTPDTATTLVPALAP